MKRFVFSAVLAATLSLSTAVSAASVEYGGITFPEGDISFADVVVSAIMGSPAATDSRFTDPDEALGAPDYSGGSLGTGSYTLGHGGSLVLQFTDNLLTGSDSTAKDLHIFEVGPDVEGTRVEISTNGSDWLSVGNVSGSTSSIDIDAFGYDSSFSFGYVRLTDLTHRSFGQTTGSTVGADIDAVGAISTVAAPAVPLPAPALLLVGGIGALAAMRRRNAPKT